MTSTSSAENGEGKSGAKRQVRGGNSRILVLRRAQTSTHVGLKRIEQREKEREIER